jgi:DNA-binding transcriptional ArsR family regulator
MSELDELKQQQPSRRNRARRASLEIQDIVDAGGEVRSGVRLEIAPEELDADQPPPCQAKGVTYGFLAPSRSVFGTKSAFVATAAPADAAVAGRDAPVRLRGRAWLPVFRASGESFRQFDNPRSMEMSPEVLKLAAMMAALGHEARLSIMRLLLSAHPEGLVAGQIQEELEIPPSTLSHHLDGLRQAGLVEQIREGKFQRYRAQSESLRSLINFLYAECCTRSRAVAPSSLTAIHHKK